MEVRINIPLSIPLQKDYWRLGPIRYRSGVPGVHILSKESQETLRRAKEKADAAEARFVKRGA